MSRSRWRLASIEERRQDWVRRMNRTGTEKHDKKKGMGTRQKHKNADNSARRHETYESPKLF